MRWRPSRSRRAARPADSSVRLLVVLVGAVSLALAVACAPAGAPTPTETRESAASAVGIEQAFATPPLYSVDGGRGAGLLLLGTIHLGPAQGWRLSPATRDALDRADAAVLELDPAAANEEKTADLLAELAVLPPSTLLPDLVSPETARLLDEQDERLARLGLPRNARIRLKPWYIVAVLLERTASEGGYSLAAALDHRVAEAMDGRPITGLETIEEQLRFFDALSPGLQDAMLHDTLARLEQSVEEVDRLVAAWHDGDEGALAEIARAGVEELPELADFYDLLLRDRNRRWVVPLRRALEDEARAGETILVAVGALHLVGPDGLPALLREAGYRVAAVDHASGRAGR